MEPAKFAQDLKSWVGPFKKFFFLNTWADSADILTTYSLLKRSLEDLLLLLHLPDAPLTLKQRAMQSLWLKASADHPLMVCAPGVTRNIQDACGIIANTPLYVWKDNLIAQTAIKFANDYLTLKGRKPIMHTHIANIYMVSVNGPTKRYGLNISLDAFAKRENTPDNINAFKDTIAEHFTVNNLLKSLVSNVMEEVRRVLLFPASLTELQAGEGIKAKLQNVPYNDIKEAIAIIDEILKPFGKDEAFGIRDLLENDQIIEETIDETYTCIPKSYEGLEIALYITLLRRVLANGYIEMPTQQMGLIKVEENPRKRIEFRIKEDGKMVFALCNEQERAKIKREAAEKAAEKARNEEAAEKKKIFNEKLIPLATQLEDLKITGNYATYFLWLRENVSNFGREGPQLRPYILSNKITYGFIKITTSLSPSSVWQSSKAHVSRQQERDGNGPIFKLIKKTIYATQKLALLEFLEQVSQAEYPVEADFWLALEAQASYIGQTEHPENYPFLGAFDKSPRHRSQTIDGFNEAKRFWSISFGALGHINGNSDFGDANRGGLRVNLQNKTDILAKMQAQIKALDNLTCAQQTSSFFPFGSPTLDQAKKDNFKTQSDIFKKLTTLLCPQTQVEQPEGLTAEDWFIAQTKLMQSRPASVVVKTFDETYAAWHEQAILTMQKKMGLGAALSQTAANRF